MKKIRNMILIFIMFILTIIFIPNSSNAAITTVNDLLSRLDKNSFFNEDVKNSVGTTISNSSGANIYLYKGGACIQDVSGGNDSSYFVQAIIDVNGDDTVTRYLRENKDGKIQVTTKTFNKDTKTYDGEHTAAESIKVLNAMASLVPSAMDQSSGSTEEYSISDLYQNNKDAISRLKISGGGKRTGYAFTMASNAYTKAKKAKGVKVRFIILTLANGQDQILYSDIENEKGTIEVMKKEENGNPLKGATFKIKNTETKTEYPPKTTTSKGIATFKNLPAGKYEVIEESAPEGYVIKSKSKTIEIKAGEDKSVTFTNDREKGKIEIVKYIEGTDKLMEGVKFNIKTVKVEKPTFVAKPEKPVNPGDNASDKKKEEYEKALKEYEEKLSEYNKYSIKKNKYDIYMDEKVDIDVITDKNGKAIINDLPCRQYEIKEVSIDKNSEFYGYVDISSTSKTVTVEKNKTKSVKFENKRSKVDLSGYVWKDSGDGKTTSFNDAYDLGEELLNGIKVDLYYNGNEFIATTFTENGAYKFNKIDIKNKELSKYRVQFEFNGLKYVAVATGKESNKSKASEIGNERENLNKKYSTITRNTEEIEYISESDTATGNNTSRVKYNDPDYTADGINLNYKVFADTTSTKYINKDNINQAKNEIEYVNFGIREREMPDLFALQDINDVKITLDGNEHIYNYNQRTIEYENKKSADPKFNVKVNFGKISSYPSYSRKIYESDIVYSNLDYKEKIEQGEQVEQKLGVYITYKIALYNEATGIDSSVNEIVNYYDSRYDIQEIKVSDGTTISIPTSTDFNQTYKKVNISLSESIDKKSSKEIYITYKLNNAAIVELLNGNMTLNSITEITSYTSSKDGALYAGIDIDSRPGNMDLENENTYEDDTCQAPAITLEPNAVRTISGSVFEDNAIQELLEKEGFNKERIGNGQYDSSVENTIGNVKVELIDSLNTKVAEVYNKESLSEKQKAETTTNENGEYSISGIIPGNYYLKYTYGNESIIKSLDETTSKTIGSLGGVQNYKSTVYRTQVDNSGNRVTSEPNNDEYWYINETSNKSAARLSDAKDEENIVNKRINIDKIDYSVVNGDMMNGLTEISATSPKLTVNIDFGINDIDNTTEFNENLIFEYNQIDFGIIERPRQDLKITKEISKIEVVLVNGQILISGDPSEQNIKYVQDLGDGRLHLEIDEELIQGATLKLTYEIKVDNKSCEIDYNNASYYWYGSVPSHNAFWKIATVEKLYDYPSGLTMDQSENTDWKIVMISSEAGQGEVEILDQNKFSEEAYKALKEYNIIMYTTIFNGMQPGETKTVEATFSKLLSNSEESLTFDNDIEVNEFEGGKPDNSIPGNYVPNEGPYEPDGDQTEIIITGPTGENQNYLPYILVGISGLIILATGVIFIKKKFINR